mmetsp:Transcript_7483/g.16178  ORF Transcript_7483/g.16178 Transcript_7483/m.16178 type:complete len:159 (+) Transcript_7483:225-701(+)
MKLIIKTLLIAALQFQSSNVNADHKTSTTTLLQRTENTKEAVTSKEGPVKSDQSAKPAKNGGIATMDDIVPETGQDSDHPQTGELEEDFSEEIEEAYFGSGIIKAFRRLYGGAGGGGGSYPHCSREGSYCYQRWDCCTGEGLRCDEPYSGNGTCVKTN